MLNVVGVIVYIYHFCRLTHQTSFQFLTLPREMLTLYTLLKICPRLLW